MRLYISHFKQISPVVREICVLENLRTYNFELCYITAQTSRPYGFTKVIKFIVYIKKLLYKNSLYADYL